MPGAAAANECIRSESGVNATLELRQRDRKPPGRHRAAGSTARHRLAAGSIDRRRGPVK